MNILKTIVFYVDLLDPLFVIMEFVPYGKLQSFLRNSRAEERQYGNLHGPSQSLTSKDLISFVYQVARGMEFLSSKGVSTKHVNNKLDINIFLLRRMIRFWAL